MTAADNSDHGHRLAIAGMVHGWIAAAMPDARLAVAVSKPTADKLANLFMDALEREPIAPGTPDGEAWCASLAGGAISSLTSGGASDTEARRVAVDMVEAMGGRDMQRPTADQLPGLNREAVSLFVQRVALVHAGGAADDPDTPVN